MIYAVFILVSVGLVCGKLAVPNIDKCVKATLNNKLSKEIEAKKGRQLFLYFGDAAIETAGVFTPDDVRRVTALAKCTAGEDSSLFEDRTASMYHFHDGGSNVTHLTGLFQTIFPELEQKIRSTAQKSIVRAEWTGDISQYGIRSVQYLSFYKAGLKAHRAGVKEKGIAEKDSAAFIIYPDPESSKQAAEDKIKQKKATFDPDADEVVKGYLQPTEPVHALTFTAIVQLTDRAQFAGGDVLVAKKPHQRTTISLHGNNNQDKHSDSSEDELGEGYDLEEDTHYDDEPEPDSHNRKHNSQPNTHHTNNNNDKYDPHHIEFDIFNAATTSISRFTPEVGNMLLVLGEHARGMRPILYGRRNTLVIEFWKYADGEVGAKRPTLGDAKLRVVDSVKGEL